MGNRVGLALGREEESQAQVNVGKCLMKEKGCEALYLPPPTVAVNLGRTLESPGPLQDIHMPHPQTQSWNLSGAWGLKFLQLPRDSSVQPGLRPTVLHISSKSVASRSPGQNSHLHLKPSSNCVQSHFLL